MSSGSDMEREATLEQVVENLCTHSLLALRADGRDGQGTDRPRMMTFNSAGAEERDEQTMQIHAQHGSEKSSQQHSLQTTKRQEQN